MQTPAGYEIVNGRFLPKDWLRVIFNPSFPYRLAHTVDAVYITTGFVVVGVAASYLRSGRFVDEARTMLSMTLWLLTVLVPLQFFLGDAARPQHSASINRRSWRRSRRSGTPSRVALTLFAIPDERAEANRYELAIPDLGSLILTHDPNGTVRGLKDWPADERPPPVIVPFFGFRVMVGARSRHAGRGRGEPMAAIEGRAFRPPAGSYGFARWLRPLGFVAVLAGWATTEVGRQPWTVYGLLRTADSVSPSLTGFDVAGFVRSAICSRLPGHVLGRLRADGQI